MHNVKYVELIKTY